MADNVAITSGAGTTIAADDIGGGVLAQRVKPVFGVDGTGVDVSSSNPLPVTSVVTSLPALAAGANVIGGVTQSGTWNVGSITTLPALVAGTAIIGKVGIDQTTPGTTNLVAAGQNGTWNITNISGTVSLPTGAATAANQSTANTALAAIQTAVQATTPSAVNLGTDAISNNGTSLTPKFAKIAASSSGANTLVAAVTSKKIRVLAYNLIGNGAVNAKFQSHVTPTDLTGLKYIAAAGGGICAPFNPLGWFETVAGEALDLNLSGAVAVGGELVYVEV